MRQVDFLIANDGHHSAMFLPVIRALQSRGVCRCRVVSLCEFRGLASPAARYREEGVPLLPLVSTHLRRSPAAGGQMRAGNVGLARHLAHELGWHLLLKKRVAQTFRQPTDLVVLPNDGAFPYDRICHGLQSHGIPFILLQEGIRLTQSSDSGQGRGGATALGVFGETSVAYFRDQGAPAERIFSVGSPRFDTLLATNWEAPARRLQKEHGLRDRFLLFLSNPIDDLGLVSSREKLRLVRQFLESARPLFDDPDFSLVIKLHRRESRRRFESLLKDLPYGRRAIVLDRADVYPLFTLARAAVIFATTAGLEALLFALPLGVLEIPGVGFAHDFVASGAARGLTWNEPLAAQIKKWLDKPGAESEAVERYLELSLSNLGSSTQAVVELIEKVLAKDQE